MNEFDIEVETNPERLAELDVMRNASANIVITVHRLNGKVVSGNVADIVVEKPAAFAPAEEQVVDTEPKSGTKLEQAHAIYKSLEDKSRGNVIKIFMANLSMTKAGASTYQYLCKKQFGA